jgi:hypothetical protein
LPHCPTASMFHCLTVPLPQCPIVSLSHSLNVPLSHCPTASVPHCLTVPQPQCSTVSLSHSSVPHCLSVTVPQCLNASMPPDMVWWTSVRAPCEFFLLPFRSPSMICNYTCKACVLLGKGPAIHPRPRTIVGQKLDLETAYSM